MKDLILVGKQGSGKGTQGEYLVKEYGFVLFETGAELRKMAKEDSDLGRKVKDITERGDLVPNEIVMEIVESFLSKILADKPALFDGIPRSEVQRVSLEKVLADAGRDFQVLEITLSTEDALKRLLIRGKCADCGTIVAGDICPKCNSKNIERRTDDNEESIMRRLKNFDEHTVPLLDIWRDQGRLLTVDGSGTIEEVWEETRRMLG